ncbi:unnamed protein product, partial [Prorocentrum cordatum]
SRLHAEFLPPGLRPRRSAAPRGHPEHCGGAEVPGGRVQLAHGADHPPEEAELHEELQGPLGPAQAGERGALRGAPAGQRGAGDRPEGLPIAGRPELRGPRAGPAADAHGCQHLRLHVAAVCAGLRNEGQRRRGVAAEAAPASGGARGGGPAVQLGGPHVHGQASGPLREPLLAARGRSGLRWPRHCHRRDFSLPERRPCGGRRSRPGRVGGPDEGQLGGVRAAGPADRAGLEGCFSRCWARQNAVQLRAREHGWSASK